MGKRDGVLRFAILAGLLASLAACGGGGGSGAGGDVPTPPVTDEYQAELFSTTRSLGDQTVAAVIADDPDGTLHFAGVPEELKDIAPKTILLGGVGPHTPQGFLRLVTEVQTTPQGLVLRTVQVPIQLAFRKLHVKLERSIPDVGALNLAPAAPKAGRVAAKGFWANDLPFDEFVFNGDSDPFSPDDQVHATGQFSGGIEYFFGLDVDWGEVFDLADEILECAAKAFIGCNVLDLLPEAKVGFGMKAGVDAQLDLTGVSFLDYQREIPLASWTDPDPIKIGPLLFFPSLDFSAKIEGAASSQFSLSSSLTGFAGTEVSYSSKHGGTLIPPTFDPPEFKANAVSATLDAYSKVRVGPRLALKLYGLMGPYAGLYAFANLEADALKSPCYRLTGGLEGDLGFLIAVDLPILGYFPLASWGQPFTLWEGEAGSGACSGSPPPGDPFVTPSFTPWAAAESNTVSGVGLPFTAPGGGSGWTDLQPTVDGRFAVAGSGARGLVKVDGDGQVVWAKRFVGPLLGDPFIAELMPDRVAVTQDAAMFVSAYPWALMKVDAAGGLIWAKQFPFQPQRNWLRVTDIAEDGAGGLYLTGGYGENASNPSEDADAVVSRLDPAGKVLWMRRFGDAGRGEMPRLLMPYGGGLVVAGSTWDPPPTSHWRLWVMRLDSDGNVLWAQEYPVTNAAQFAASAHPLSALQTPEGDLVFGGTLEDAPSRAFFLKIKPDGSLPSTPVFTVHKAAHPLNLEDLELTSLVALPTSGYLAAGTYTPYPYDLEPDLWVASLDGVGKIQWIDRIRSPDYSAELTPTLRYTEDGGAMLAGYTETLAGGGSGVLAMKAHAKDGAITFGGASGVASSSLTTVLESGYQISASPWSPAVEELGAMLAPVTVTVEALPAQRSQLAP